MYLSKWPNHYTLGGEGVVWETAVCVLCSWTWLKDELNFFYYYLKKVYQESMTTLNGKYYACVVTVWTGSGKYYCSGNDQGNFTRILPEGLQKMANDAWKVFKYVRGSMSFPLSQILQSSVYSFLWATSVLQKHKGVSF